MCVCVVHLSSQVDLICHMERLVDHLHCMLAAIPSSIMLSHGVRWNICYCAALYSKYKRTYALWHRALVTDWSGKGASYMPYGATCRSFTLHVGSNSIINNAVAWCEMEYMLLCSFIFQVQTKLCSVALGHFVTD